MHVKSRSEAKGNGGETENIKGRGKEGILGGKLINSHTHQHTHAHTHTHTNTHKSTKKFVARGWNEQNRA